MSLSIHPVLTKMAPNTATEDVDGTRMERFAFPDSDDEYALGSIFVPSDVNTSGTVTFRVALVSATAAAAKNVQLRLEHVPLANGEASDVSAAWTAEDSGDIALDATQDDVTIATWTETMANLGWNAGEWVALRLSRIATSGTDLTGDVYVLGFTVEVPTFSTVQVPVCISTYVEQNQRNDAANQHGGILVLKTAQTLNSGAGVNVSPGLSKILLVVNAGTDTAGDITLTGTSVDRDTGAETASDTDTITIAGTTTDGSTTDAQGNAIYTFTNAYVSSKWFKGTVALTTADVDLTDLDIYQVAFEQFDDQASITLDSYDLTALITNATAWIYSYLYKIAVTGDACSVSLVATLALASGDGVANRFYRLRKGALATAVNGTTDGIFTQTIFGPAASTYWDDVCIKVWARIAVSLE